MMVLPAMAAFFSAVSAGVAGLIEGDWWRATAWACASYWALATLMERRGQ